MQYWSPNFYSCALDSISHSISLLVGLYRLYIFAPAQSHMTDVVMYTLCELRGPPRGFPAPARPAPPIWPPGQRSMTIATTYTMRFQLPHMIKIRKKKEIGFGALFEKTRYL